MTALITVDEEQVEAGREFIRKYCMIYIGKEMMKEAKYNKIVIVNFKERKNI